MKQRQQWLLAGVLALAAGSIKPAHAGPPAVPAMPEATPGNGAVLLTFGAIPTAASYNIYRSNADKEGDQPAKVGSAASGFFIDTAVTNGTNYSYTIKAVDKSGAESAASEPVLVAPQVPIGPGLMLHYLESNPAIKPATLTVDAASDTLTFRSNGEDIWDNKDSGDFLAMPVAGDYSISFEVLEKPVAEAPNTSNNVKVGPMIRDSLTVGSRYAYLHTTSGRGVLWERREAFLGNNGADSVATGAEGSNPQADFRRHLSALAEADQDGRDDRGLAVQRRHQLHPGRGRDDHDELRPHEPGHLGGHRHDFKQHRQLRPRQDQALEHQDRLPVESGLRLIAPIWPPGDGSSGGLFVVRDLPLPPVS